MQKDQNPHLVQFREALQREFLERSKTNSAYSLRTFARSLGIDQSFLSKILKGQRPVTAKLVEKIGPQLRLKPTQINELFTAGTAAMPSLLSTSDDEFDLLSEWHHAAILELAKTANFDPTPAKISHRLGIHVEEVRAALTRLERLGIIRVDQDKIEALTPVQDVAPTTASTEAHRMLQKTLIAKSLSAIEEVPLDLRENSSLTVAVNKKRLPEFKQKLEMIKSELAEYFTQDSNVNADEVYQITVALFPLTKINTKSLTE